MNNRSIMPLALLLCLTVEMASAQYKCFYANLHAHTSFSDGKSTPDTAYAYARDVAGINIQALTDHNNGYYDYNPALYLVVQQAAAAYTEDGVFVALAGQEIGNSGGFGHIACYETPTLSPSFNSASDLLACYKWLLSSGRPAMYCHPTLFQDEDFNYFYFYPEYLPAMDLLEVINQNGNYQDEYLNALNKGWQVGATANQDNHDSNWGAAANSQGRVPLTGIWADTLTKQSVLQAMQARRTFATLVYPAGDRMEVYIKAENHWQGEYFTTTSTELNIEIGAKAVLVNFNKLYLYGDGLPTDSITVQKTDTVWRFTKQVDLGKHYYFVKALQTDGDMSWTSPVFVDVIEEKAKNRIITWPTPVKNAAQIVYDQIDNVDYVKATVYDLSGRKVWENSNTAPTERIIWNGCCNSGQPAPEGIYIIKIEQRSPAASNISIGRTVVAR
jgi:hypothetical protein